MNIIHVDTQDTWRGGQRQALELIKRLNKHGIHNVLACKRSSEISRRAEQVGVDVVNFAFRGEWDIVSAMKLRSYIRRKKIDIAHVHSSHAHGIAYLALYKPAHCKLVVSRRVDFHVKGYLSRKFKYGPSVSRIIAVSDAIKRVLTEDGIDPQKIVTIRSGFVKEDITKNSTKKDLREKLNIKDASIVVATVAALAPHKAHYVLIKAAYKVLQKHPDTVFLLAGEGEMRPEIEKDIRNLGIEESIKLLGFVKDIETVYNTADIFAMSSSEEGLGSSLFDAMYFNLPVVATSAGGIPEIVKDGINGFIVPVNDYISFADRLNYLIENTEERKNMGGRSSQILDDNMIDRTVEKTIGVYKELISSNNT